MNSIYRLCFHPTIDDRYWLAWLSVISCLGSSCVIAFALIHHLHWCVAVINLIPVILNAISIYANWSIYRDGKKNQSPT